MAPMKAEKEVVSSLDAQRLGLGKLSRWITPNLEVGYSLPIFAG